MAKKPTYELEQRVSKSEKEAIKRKQAEEALRKRIKSGGKLLCLREYVRK